MRQGGVAADYAAILKQWGNDTMKPDSLYATLTRKARTASDAELAIEYSWINPSHLTVMLKAIRLEALRRQD